MVVPDGSVGRVVLADNLAVLADLPDDSVDLIYVDPPFNTGQTRILQQIKATRDDDGDRVGFQGRRYRTLRLGQSRYVDIHDDYLAFIEPRIVELRRVLQPHGSLYFHIDYREAHYCKILLDIVFGRDAFLNEIIWAYDYGGRTARRWPAKHDTILVYVKDTTRYYFDAEAVERIPYMAPGLVGPEKAARGKLPTDTWWHTIVPPGGKERTGYPTQKPLGILRRIVQASSPPGGLVADFFAGSGTTGAACLELDRRFLLVDDNPEALTVMRHRFADRADVTYEDRRQGEAENCQPAP
jgi:site-specific DNA-methyltransferase (adenine-specific)